MANCGDSSRVEQPGIRKVLPANGGSTPTSSLQNIIKEIKDGKRSCDAHGAYREVYKIGDLAIKIPTGIYRGSVAGLNHAQHELEMIKIANQFQILLPYIPHIIESDYESGIIVMPWYSRKQVSWKNRDILIGRFKICGFDHVDNFGTNRFHGGQMRWDGSQLKLVDWGHILYEK